MLDVPPPGNAPPPLSQDNRGNSIIPRGGERAGRGGRILVITVERVRAAGAKLPNYTQTDRPRGRIVATRQWGVLCSGNGASKYVVGGESAAAGGRRGEVDDDGIGGRRMVAAATVVVVNRVSR